MWSGIQAASVQERGGVAGGKWDVSVRMDTVYVSHLWFSPDAGKCESAQHEWRRALLSCTECSDSTWMYIEYCVSSVGIGLEKTRWKTLTDTLITPMTIAAPLQQLNRSQECVFIVWYCRFSRCFQQMSVDVGICASHMTWLYTCPFLLMCASSIGTGSPLQSIATTLLPLQCLTCKTSKSIATVFVS